MSLPDPASPPRGIDGRLGLLLVVAEADLEAGAAGASRIAIASDDEFRLIVNGKEALAHSPPRTPRAGLPGGPPLAFDDLDRVVPDTAEREVVVPLAPGRNRIVVQDCRVGDDFGVFVRVK